MNVQLPIDTATLRAREKAIAEKYIGGTPWLMVAWGLGNIVLWLALWPLTISGVLPLWAGFAIATVCVTASYLPSHDAQHDIIVPRTSPQHWLNELVATNGDEASSVASLSLDCPLCSTAHAPPPAVQPLALLHQPLAYRLQPQVAARIAALTAPPLPARGPPYSL